MKELPENQTLSKQINETLKDRVITEVFNATKFHKNTFYFGDPLHIANYSLKENQFINELPECMSILF